MFLSSNKNSENLNFSTVAFSLFFKVNAIQQNHRKTKLISPQGLIRRTLYTGGRKSKYLFVRHWRIWQFYRKFFPIELVKTCDLDPNKTYMFCSHPHGILCSGAFCAFNTEG